MEALLSIDTSSTLHFRVPFGLVIGINCLKNSLLILFMVHCIKSIKDSIPKVPVFFSIHRVSQKEMYLLPFVLFA